VLGAVLCGLGVLGPSAALPSVPNLSWTEFLPGLPSKTEPQPRPVAHCREPSLRCVTVQIRRLRRAEQRFGCDHRAVFATTYRVLTRTLKRTLKRDPDFFQRPRYFFIEDAVFANVYFDTLRAWRRGEHVDPAWRIALATARSRDVGAGQDMLLGINAHVQNDMPFVVASLGVATRSGRSRKLDHDRVNEVLNRAYAPVVRAVRKRYDPTVDLTNPEFLPVDDLAGLELVRTWREIVWRNAERLVNAETAAQRRQVARQVKANAALWARSIASVETPGYRDRRDAYCKERLAN
jgi:hypothetical protein